MLEFLFATALQFVTVWENPHTGAPTYIAWCRATRQCESDMYWMSQTVVTAAEEQDVDPLEIFALLQTESMQNPRAKSKKIGAFGWLQLHPKGPMGIRAKRECRKAKMTRRQCDEHTLRLSIEFYKIYKSECKTLPRTYYAWRTGECGRGPYSDKTHRKFLTLKRQYAESLERDPEERRLAFVSDYARYAPTVMCTRHGV